MSHSLLKPMLAAGIAIAAVAAPIASVPAFAQATAPAPDKIAYVDVDGVVANCNAFKTAEQQRQTTYASQIAQYKSRAQAYQAQIKPLVDAFNAERAKASPNRTILQQKAEQIQSLQDKAKAELQEIIRPVALSRDYVNEQIEDKLREAIDKAAAAKGYTFVLRSDNVLYPADGSHNLSQEVVSQLNTLIPAAQLIPPQGWLPRAQREQQAQQQAAQQPAQPGAPTGR